MALIQSGNSSDLLTVNASKQALVTDTLRSRAGVYIGHSGLLNAVATAHAPIAGFLWLLNPTTSPHRVALRRIEVASSSAAAAAAVTRVTAERVTFTGAHTGAQLVPAKVASTTPNAAAILAANSSGVTITAGAVIYGFQLVNVITAAGSVVPVMQEYEPKEEGMPILNPGEGIVLRQPDAGVATDPRRITINLAWEEYV